MPLHRRAILKGGLAAIAGTGLPGFAPRAQTTRPEMRVIPSSGAAIPVVGLGTWITFNVGTDPVLLDESVAVMAAFFEAGGTVIDSSPMYGSSQDTVGHGLAKLGYPPVFAADKVWTPAGGDGREQIGDSRRRWGVRRFDLMQVHNLVDWREHLETLFAMKAEGEIAHIGITGTITGAGRIDLGRNTIDVFIGTKRASTEFSALDVPFHISGPIASPSVSPVLSASVRDRLRAADDLSDLPNDLRQFARGNHCLREK